MKQLPHRSKQLHSVAVCNLDKGVAPNDAELAWILVLDDMEVDLAGLRRFTLDSEELFELPTSWEPPVSAGPLPASLQVRAQAIFEQMQELSVVLKSRRDETARQMRAVESVPRVETGTSLYIDVVG